MKSKHNSSILGGASCVLVAFKNACSWLDEHHIRDVGIVNKFYNPRSGTTTGAIPSYMDHLGIQYEKTFTHNWMSKPPTVHRFAKANPEGVFLMSVNGHAFLLIDGKVFDPNLYHYGIQRRVLSAFRILNHDVEKEDRSWNRKTKFVLGVGRSKRTGLGFRKGTHNYNLFVSLLTGQPEFDFEFAKQNYGFDMKTWVYFIERGIIKKKGL